MEYTPVKNRINQFITHHLLRKFFYISLDCFILRQWYVKKYLKKYLPPRQNFLFYDAGSGFCQYSDYVLKRYSQANVVAVDLKDDYLVYYDKYIQDKYSNRFSYIQADLENFSLPTKRADFILAIDILEHIIHDDEALKNFSKSMKDQGYLIISTPSNAKQTALFTAEHVRNGYSLAGLSEQLNRQGFTIVECEYSYGFWGSIYWFLMMYNSLIILNRGKIMMGLLPIYILIVYLPSLFAMLLDYWGKNKSGKGIILVAQKK